ncbi:MAG: NEW3 domain-containing protein [Candidatus Bipolaricaulota bacterium]|nr:NEW3 domain-containing protein [Candidatus Bipolaricaulota bacterium]MCX7844519.1 NEW3 domain-containing protein [Candidatus Bipolaricaulota bacterium]MDW8152392.1 NEW3 domain-containing protein [Candidatus Bipolaricaulota bacterium]
MGTDLKRRILGLLFLLVGVGVGALAERSFMFYTEYPTVVLSPDRELSLDVILRNTGVSSETIVLEVAGPAGWNARFETSSYPVMQIGAVHLLAEAEKPTTVRFKAKPPSGARTGTYTFTLTARTEDGKLSQSLPVRVVLQATPTPTDAEKETKLTLSVSYPSLENPAGKDFTYDITIRNEAPTERVVNLRGQVPFLWRAYFTPRWQTDTRITSIKVGANSVETVRFVVTPPVGVEQGEYPLVFVAQADGDTASLSLKAVVTGTYDLRLGTESEVTGQGDTRNIRATEGRERTFTLYLWNAGTAPLTHLTFFATKPAGWEVTFVPERIEELPPLSLALKPEKVTVKIKPAARAIPGDYQVSLVASATQDREQMDLRVTVAAGMGWGWVGVGVVVVVVAGLTGIFVRLGRR